MARMRAGRNVGSSSPLIETGLGLRAHPTFKEAQLLGQRKLTPNPTL